MNRALLLASALTLAAGCSSCGSEISCDQGLTLCGSACVSLAGDAANCGACGTACTAPDACIAGVCGGCTAGLVNCSGACVDPLTDRLHCGAAGTCTGAEAGVACEAGQVCVDAACSWNCPAGQVNCAGLCIDPLTNRLHCGATNTCLDAEAGVACPSGQACVDAVCSTSCPAGQLNCSGFCVDPLTDRLHCGATNTCLDAEAGVACPSGQACVDGGCSTSCPGGQVNCAGLCVDPLTDRLHCGATNTCLGAEAGIVCPPGQACVDGGCSWSCPTGQINCGGFCVDPLANRSYCGATNTCTGAEAGVVCLSGQVCIAGACAWNCPSGQINCNGYCVDPLSSRFYCGATNACVGADAGIACAAGQVCVAGACAWNCPTGQVNCDGYCVDPLTDRLHCGATNTCTGLDAGVACAAGQACVAGACSWSCPAGQINCSGYCIDPLSSRFYCGATNACTGADIGVACAAGQVCVSGACAWNCPTGQVNCDGYCVDPLTDRLHCGATNTCTGAEAGVACAPGQACVYGGCSWNCPTGQVNCGGYCVDPLTDRLHCGATLSCTGAEAGVACDAGQVCVAGVCDWSCPTGQVNCNGYCVDPLTDGANCGACGVTCGIDFACEAGTCQQVCGEGLWPCDVGGYTVCVSLTSDDAHCGVCNRACGDGKTCVDAQCLPVCPSPFVVCGPEATATCEDTATTPFHCGGCDVACAAGEVCERGACVAACPFGQVHCGASCVALESDPANCGECGEPCLAGDTCVSGSCTSAACPGGALGLPGVRSSPGPYRPTAMAQGDFDGDGFTDLAVVDDRTATSGRLLLFRGNGDGTFATPTVLMAPPAPSAVAAGDLDGDGFLDLVVGTTDPARTTVAVYLGDGAGGFQEAPAYEPATGPAPRAVALVDLDGDGDPDLVVGNGPALTTGNLKVFLNDITGASGLMGAAPSPGAPSSLHDVAPDVRAVGAGVLVNLGPPSVIAVSATEGAVLLGNGDGTLGAPASTFAVGADPAGLAVADLDGDGCDDWVVANAGSNDVSILIDERDALFQCTGRGIGQTQTAGLEPRAVSIFDLDGDGAPDIVTADAGGNALTVIRNARLDAACPAPAACFDTIGARPLGLRPTALVAARPGPSTAPHLFAANALGRSVSSLRANGFTDAAFPFRHDGGASTQAVALGHLDADANLDAVTADPADDRLQVWTGAPGGFLSPPVDVAYPVGALPVDVVLADVDGDGRTDLVTALEGLASVDVAWGDGVGGFGATTRLDTGLMPESVAVADFNGDGWLDVVSADAGADQLTLYLSTGPRAWAPPVHLVTGAGPRAVTTADMDGRGCLDVISTDAGAGSLSIFHCDPTTPGQFYLSVVHHPVGPGALRTAAGDLDGDGDPDLVVTRAADVLVVENTGLGFMAAGVPHLAGASPRHVSVVDLDGDLRPDLVVSSSSEGAVSVLRGRGDLTFGAPTRHDAGGECWATATADLDGDGRADLSAATSTPAGSFLGGGLATLANRCLP